MFWLLTGFILFIFLLLAIDLGVFHRHAHQVSVREALGWSAMWVALGLSFTVFIYFAYEGQWFGLGTKVDPIDHKVNNGAAAAVKYLTGYVLEKTLSVDNIFVIAMIFGFFAVPQIYQHRVLYWGILGALLMRGVMIIGGAALIRQFHWILYVFGVFLLFTGVKMLFLKTEEMDPGQNWLIRWTRRLFPVTTRYHGNHFLVRVGSAAAQEAEQPGMEVTSDPALEAAKVGTLMLTPLALCLVIIEVTDVIFAVDSIPAIFAITADWFLVFTSNVFAILGLRSLYFVLSGMIDAFRYLKLSLALVLILVGAKMLAADWLRKIAGEYFNFFLLATIVTILSAGVISSMVHDRIDLRNGKAKPPGPEK